MDSKKILVVSFSQTGTVHKALENALLPFRERGAAIEMYSIETEKPLPFPWGFFRFFSIMPETVLGPSVAIRPLEIPEKDWDLVVLGFPVWFLSVAQPMKTFLLERKWLRGKTILPVITCRELWWSGYQDFLQITEPFVANILEPLVYKEPLASWKTYLSTPIYLVTGKKVFKNNAASWRETIPSAGNLFMESVGKKSFRFWARLIKHVSSRESIGRNVAICFFFLYLLFAIPILKLIGGVVQFVDSNLKGLRKQGGRRCNQSMSSVLESFYPIKP